MKHKLFYLLPFVLYFCFAACSVPNLEQPSCTESRDAVKEFYSLHFANDMKPSENYLNLRKSFITTSLQNFISKQLNQSSDFFTLTDDYAKAFRIGECKVVNDKTTNVEILIFWKTDTRTEQKAVHTEVVNENGNWLINKVEN